MRSIKYSLKRSLSCLLAVVMTVSLIPVSAAATDFDSTAAIAAEHWRVGSSGEYSAAFTYDDLTSTGLNPGLYRPPVKVDENKVNLYVTSSNMSADYEIPNFKDKDGNTWYLNSIAVSNASSLLGISTGDTKEIFASTQIKAATNKTDYNYNLSQIDIDPATVSGITTKYYFIRYGWTSTPPEEWEGGGSGEPQGTYSLTYEFNLPEKDMILYPIEYDEDLGENRINVDSDGGVTTVGSQVAAMNTTIPDGLNFVVAGALASEYKGFLIFTKGENPTYYYLDGWKIGDTKYEMGQTVQASTDLAGGSNTITVIPNWVKIEPLTKEQLEDASNNLSVKVDPLIRDNGVAEDVLLTQWTTTDKNTINGQKTASHVVLDETGTISYQVSALVNHAGVTDPNGMEYSSDFATFTFALDIDKQLEFANVADDGTVTVGFQSSVLTPTGTNIKNGDAEGATISQNGDKWTIKFNSASVPQNKDGSMHLEVTVQWIEGKHTDGDVTRPLVFSGLDFKLKKPVTGSDDFELNTSVNVTGKMDLRNKVPNHLRVYYRVVRGQLTQSEEWQKQFGESYDPIAFVHALQFMDKKLAYIDMSKDNTTLEANTATAVIVESTPVTLTPADMTIYMGGDGGYDAVVNKDGHTVTSNSLPHPIFQLDGAPSGVTFNNQTFTNAESGNSWTLVPETCAADYYHFENEAGTKVGVRVQYSNENGAVTSDKFDPATEKDVFTEYNVSVYTGDTKGIVTAVASDGKNYLVETGTGTLTVRAVADKTDPTSDVEKTAPTTKLDPNTATAVEPENTTYTLNNTGVELPDDSKPSLLFDDIITSDGVDRIAPLKEAVDEKLGGADANREYQIKYLDLVDANNGNAWITSSAGIDIYWGYPEGTSQSTEFTLLHFKDLHRDTSGGHSTGFDPDDINNSDVDVWKTGKELTNTEYGIKFHVGKAGFSPFALVWTESTGGGGGGTTYYTITATADDGGSIDPSGSVRVASGRDKTFTITADEGYEIADVLVDGESVGAVSEYTFENVRKKHTIEARFEATGEIPVKDPDETGVSDWLNTDDHIAYMSGYPEGDFRPDVDMTRAEAAQMFYNLLLDKDTAAEASFSDVPANAWYAEAVNALASIGVIEGIGDNQYAPDRAITRAEFTAIAMRFADLETGGENIFSDVAENAWYYDYVVGSIQYGWINGYPDGTFRPENTISRVEVTTIVNRMLGRSADENFVDSHADELRQFTDVNDSHWGYYNIMEAANAHDFTMENNTENWTALR